MGVEPYIGQVQAHAGNYPPRGWAFCWGQLIPISQNPTLYSLIGVQFGGDGRTTFALPDFRARVPVGAGQGAGLTPRPAGQHGGASAIALTQVELPPHGHAANGTATMQVEAAPSRGTLNAPENGCVLAASYNVTFDADIQWYVPDAGSTVPLGAVEGQVPQVNISAAGASHSHSNMQPVQGINFIIALTGIYPPRP